MDAEGNVTTYTYPTADRGEPLSLTAPDGYGTCHDTTWYYYNPAGQVTTEFLPVATTAGTPSSTTGYIMESSAI